MAVQLANAESKCRELAAENAALKSFGDKLYSMYKGLKPLAVDSMTSSQFPISKRLSMRQYAVREIKTIPA